MSFPNPKKRNNVIFLLLSIYNLSPSFSFSLSLFFLFTFFEFFPELEFALGIFNKHHYSVRPFYTISFLCDIQDVKFSCTMSKKLNESDEYESQVEKVKYILEEQGIIIALSA